MRGWAPRVLRSWAWIMGLSTYGSCRLAMVQKEWYALLANAEFYFNDVQNEAMAEQLREKKR